MDAPSSVTIKYLQNNTQHPRSRRSCRQTYEMTVIPVGRNKDGHP
ncbi:hypothetical protein BIFDEN_02098 [Bifidobacterium dentium ATCC 27678]|nr:hypothetical protein BIFDEN_02098 [Bifidobacterium dentium ATCC 27678]